MTGIPTFVALQAIPDYDETVCGIQEFQQACLVTSKLIHRDAEAEMVHRIRNKLSGNASNMAHDRNITTFIDLIRILDQEIEIQSFMQYMGDQTHGHNLQPAESIQEYSYRTERLERFLMDAASSRGNRTTVRNLVMAVSNHILGMFIDGLPILYQIRINMHRASTLPLAISIALEEETRLNTPPPPPERPAAPGEFRPTAPVTTTEALWSNMYRNPAQMLHQYYPNQEYPQGPARFCCHSCSQAEIHTAEYMKVAALRAAAAANARSSNQSGNVGIATSFNTVRTATATSSTTAVWTATNAISSTGTRNNAAAIATSSNETQGNAASTQGTAGQRYNSGLMGHAVVADRAPIGVNANTTSSNESGKAATAATSSNNFGNAVTATTSSDALWDSIIARTGHAFLDDMKNSGNWNIVIVNSSDNMSENAAGGQQHQYHPDRDCSDVQERTDHSAEECTSSDTEQEPPRHLQGICTVDENGRLSIAYYPPALARDCKKLKAKRHRGSVAQQSSAADQQTPATSGHGPEAGQIKTATMSMRDLHM